MPTPIPNSPFPPAPQQPPPAFRGRRGASTSNILFAVGVVLVCFGGAITGNNHWNLVGLALLVFSSLVHLD